MSLSSATPLPSQLFHSKERLKNPRCLLVAYSFVLNDPPARQAAESLSRQGYEVRVVQTAPDKSLAASNPPSFATREVHGPERLAKLKPLYNWLRWRRFIREVDRQIGQFEPDLIVTIMLHALASLPKSGRLKKRKLVSCIYDIRPIANSGKLDRIIFKEGWKRLAEADVTWSSDVYKARLTQERGRLPDLPIICHNCPTLDFLPAPQWPRDGWLRRELRHAGATIGKVGGSILLRAGAVGECGGLEETLEGMKDLPSDYLFVMMGRPSASYKQKLSALIARLELQNRAFIWDRVSDEVWKKALQGADIGHLIHGPFPTSVLRQPYELNSSLSNNRLFQYMAAGLPIISYDDPRMDAIYREASCFRVARLAYLKEDIQRTWKEFNGASLVELGQAARKAHETKYHWAHQFTPVLNRLESLR